MKIFETNIENGSLIDKISNSIGTLGTSAKLLRTEKGMVLAKDKITYTKKVKGQTPVSIIASFFLSTKSTDAYIVSWGSVSANDKGLLLYASNGSTLIAIINYGAGIVFSGSAILKKNVWNNIAFTWNGLSGGIAKLYVNSVLINSQAITNSWTGDSASPITLNSTAGLTSNIRISKIIVYDHILNQKEINNNYLDFVNSKRFKQKTAILQPNLPLLKSTELQETGLLGAYNFNPINGKIPNIAFDNSTNNYNARQYDVTNISRAQYTREGLKIKLPINRGTLGTFGTLINLGTIYSIEFTFKWPTDTPNSYMLGIPGYNCIRLDAGGNNLTHYVLVGGNSSGSASWSWVQNFTLNTFHRVVITRNGANANAYVNGVRLKLAFTSGPNQTTAQYTINDIIPFNGVAYDLGITLNSLKLYKGVVLDESYIKNSYNQFASKEVLYEDFSQYPAGTTKAGNWRKAINSANQFTINEIASTLTYLPKGTKCISLINSGNFVIPSNTAYGTWEFTYKTVPTGAFEQGIWFITDMKATGNNATSYMIYFGTNRNIYLWRGGSFPLLIAGTWTNNTVYKIKVTRNFSNLFKVYINDTFRGSVTDSTITTCNGFGFYLSGTGPSYLTNIKITQGVTA